MRHREREQDIKPAFRFVEFRKRFFFFLLQEDTPRASLRISHRADTNPPSEIHSGTAEALHGVH